MDSFQDFRKLYLNNIILFIILLFIVIYIVINWSIISSVNISNYSEYFSGQIVKPTLITGIIFLLFHMMITWDDNDDRVNILGQTNYKSNNYIKNPDFLPNPIGPQLEIKIPNRYEQVVQQVQQVEQVPQTNPIPIENKFRIVNKYSTNNLNKIDEINSMKNYKTNSSKHSIFIPHNSKFGLKF